MIKIFSVNLSSVILVFHVSVFVFRFYDFYDSRIHGHDHEFVFRVSSYQLLEYRLRCLSLNHESWNGKLIVRDGAQRREHRTANKS